MLPFGHVIIKNNKILTFFQFCNFQNLIRNVYTFFRRFSRNFLDFDFGSQFWDFQDILIFLNFPIRNFTILWWGHCCYNVEFRPGSRGRRYSSKTKSPDKITFAVGTRFDHSCKDCFGNISHAIEHPGEIVNVTELHLHPRFKKNKDSSYSYDFCLAKVTPIYLLDCQVRAQPAVFSETFFEQRNLKTLAPCVIAGWGVTETGGQNVELKKAKVAVLSDRICNKTYHGLNSDMFCAGELNTRNARDSCNGDSGGPIFCKNDEEKFVQYGIISGGVPGRCGEKNLPGIYSKIERAIGWMKNVAGIVNGIQAIPETFTLTNSEFGLLNGVYLKQNLSRNGKPIYLYRGRRLGCGIMFYDIALPGWPVK